MAYNPLTGLKLMWHKFFPPKDETPKRHLSSYYYPSEIVRSVDELLESIARDQCELDSSPTEQHIEATCVEKKSNDLPYIRMKKSTGQQMKSLRVLGVEMSNFSEVQQYLFITSFLFTVQIMYGYTQEYIIVSLFQQTLPLFIAMFQFCGYALFIELQRLLEGSSPRVVPKRYYVCLAIMQVANQCLSNIALEYVNYTVKVLFKSSRIVPTMLFGAFYHKRRYSITDYIAVVFIVMGLVIFLEADSKSSSSYDMTGIFLLCICLFVDGAMLNIQEEIMHRYLCQPSEIIYYMYTGGSFIMLVLNVWSGELWGGVVVLWENNDFKRMYLPMAVFSLTGFLSISCTSALVKHFGALTTSITSTIRRGLALVISFVLFPKPVYAQHFIGWGVFTVGALTKAFWKSRNPSKLHR